MRQDSAPRQSRHRYSWKRFLSKVIFHDADKIRFKDHDRHMQQSTQPSQRKRLEHQRRIRPSLSFSRRSARSKESRSMISKATTADQLATRETLNRSDSTTSAWPQNESAIATTANSLKLPTDAWTLKLPDAVVTAPSLMALTETELRCRGVYTPRPTFESARVRPSLSCSRPSPSGRISFRSALSTFAPHPGTRHSLFDEQSFMQEEASSHPRQDFPGTVPLALVMLGTCFPVFATT